MSRFEHDALVPHGLPELISAALTARRLDPATASLAVGRDTGFVGSIVQHRPPAGLTLLDLRHLTLLLDLDEQAYGTRAQTDHVRSTAASPSR